MVKSLDLPPCYLYDFASRDCVPLRVKRNVTQQSVSRYIYNTVHGFPKIADVCCAGIVWQSPLLRHAFMSMALRHNCQIDTTYGYLGFQSNIGTKAPLSPGDRLLKLIKRLKNKAHEPMLLPALAAGIWTEYLHNENHRSAKKLREIQLDIGVVDLYLQPKQKRIRQPIRPDVVHSKIVSQHAFLTNGVSEFLADLFLSIASATDNGEAVQVSTTSQQPGQQQNQQQRSRTSAIAMTEELSGYVNHMRMRARAEIQHHDRILSRVSMYLQVVSQTVKQDHFSQPVPETVTGAS